MTLSWQVPLTEVAGSAWPVVVVGCGPAGANAALHLAKRGVPVLVIEREAFPRDKVCGDALMPDALRAIERAGLIDVVRARGVPSERIVLSSPSRVAVNIHAPTLAIRRRVLDTVLAEGAAKAGAVIARGTVHSMQSDGRRVRVGVAESAAEITASIVLVATGADVSLLSRGSATRSPRPSAIAVRKYVRSDVRLDHLVVSFDRSILPGYAWIFPLPDGEYNIGCGVVYAHRKQRVDLSRRLDTFLHDFPAAAEIMRGATTVQTLRGAVLRTGLSRTRTFAPNVIAIGETCGATLPLSGEGVGKAMETGERAAEIVSFALERGDVAVADEFETYLTTLSPIYDAYRTGERWLAYPLLNDGVMRLVRRSSYARRAIAEIIDEIADPGAIFSLRGIVRVLAS